MRRLTDVRRLLFAFERDTKVRAKLRSRGRLHTPAAHASASRRNGRSAKDRVFATRSRHAHA